MLKKKHEKLIKKNNVLQSGNEELIFNIEAINEKLQSSHKVINTLHQELKKFQSKQNDYELLRAKWVEAKKTYQTKIEELKSQLTDARSMVSVDRYNKALESAEVLRKCLKGKEKEIEKLLCKISQLETTLIDRSSKENTFDQEQNGQKVFTPSPSKRLHRSSRLSNSKLKNTEKQSVKKSSQSAKKRLALTPLQVNNVGITH